MGHGTSHQHEIAKPRNVCADSFEILIHPIKIIPILSGPILGMKGYFCKIKISLWFVVIPGEPADHSGPTVNGDQNRPPHQMWGGCLTCVGSNSQYSSNLIFGAFKNGLGCPEIFGKYFQAPMLAAEYSMNIRTVPCFSNEYSVNM